MYIGKVIGMVVATTKDHSLVGKKLLIVDKLHANGTSQGNSEVAIDTVGAGTGELVLVADGSAARKTLSNPESTVDAAIVAIIDSLEVNE